MTGSAYGARTPALVRSATGRAACAVTQWSLMWSVGLFADFDMRCDLTDRRAVATAGCWWCCCSRWWWCLQRDRV